MKIDYIAEQGQENCLWYWSHKANQVSCPLWTLHSIYQAHIQPHFNFCYIFQGNCGVTLQDKLQKLQNRPPRVLTRSNYNADVKNLFELLGWKTLVSQRQIVRATMVFLNTIVALTICLQRFACTISMQRLKSLYMDQHLNMSAPNLSIAILVIA